MTYTISDIHGEYEKFLKMLELIDFKSSDKLYILGDVMDRGILPIKTMLYIMKHSNMEFLLGNHEEFFLEYHKNGCIDNDGWLRCGGMTTFEEIMTYGQEIETMILSFLKKAQLIKRLSINGNIFFLSHAGLEFNEKTGELLNTQYRDFMLWAREEFLHQNLSNVPDGTYVIFGHTPTFTIDKKPKEQATIWKQNHKIGIDCGAVFGGRMACLRLEDMEEFYV